MLARVRGVPGVIGGLAAALVLLCWAATAGAQDARTLPTPAPGTLYVLQAQGGTLERAPGGWVLMLREPDARVTAFSDRPARVGGAVALRRFVARWRASFGADPPNAALQLDRAPAGRDVVLLELRRPRHDRRAQTLTFRVRPLRTTDRRRLSTIARRADRRVAARFGRASLFIDDGPSAFGYGVTFNLLGGVPSGAPVDFSLTLGNSQFLGPGQLEQLFGIGGRTVTPSMTWDVSATQLALTVPSGSQAFFVMTVGIPSANVVDATVVLPFGYSLQISSEAGVVDVQQSGPVTFPAPSPP